MEGKRIYKHNRDFKGRHKREKEEEEEETGEEKRKRDLRVRGGRCRRKGERGYMVTT